MNKADFVTYDWSRQHGLIDNRGRETVLPAQIAWAIGNFDGVHRGHQQVLSALLTRNNNDAMRMALTFTPHPRAFFARQKQMFYLTPRSQKQELIAAMGFDGLVFAEFDADLAAMTAKDFAVNVMINQFNARHIAVGEDFRFGSGRAGTPEHMIEWLTPLNCKVDVVPPLYDHQIIISSSQIRNLIAAGEVDRAADLLGYHWFIKAKVEHGDKRGRQLGFPTANLILDDIITLCHGVYAVMVRYKDRYLKGAANFGNRPTFNGKKVLLEVYIFDFDEDIYDEEIEVVFFARLRPEEKFNSTEALIKQMNADVDLARHVLDNEASLSSIDGKIKTMLANQVL